MAKDFTKASVQELTDAADYGGAGQGAIVEITDRLRRSVDASSAVTERLNTRLSLYTAAILVVTILQVVLVGLTLWRQWQ